MNGSLKIRCQNSFDQKLIMFAYFEKNKDIGILIIRLFLGIRLIYGVQDNILRWEKMKEFEHFLNGFGFPFPLLCAIVSVYAQAVAGVLILFGWHIRWAALLMIINFTVAIIMVHWGQTFEQMTTVLFMLITSIMLLFCGGGKFSLERQRQ